MNIEQESLEFVTNMMAMYFVTRDADGLLANMHCDISLLGTGENEISRGALAVRQGLVREFGEYADSFELAKNELYTSKLSDNVCVVYGLLKAIPTQIEVVEEQNLHITAICIKTEDDMKLIHCNVSVPDCLLGESNYYVAPHERVDNQKLRGTLEKREQWLKNLTHNIPGGVHQCHNDPNLTLINMSDSFLEMFGYSRDEVKNRFDDKFINMIYPNDRAEMIKSMYDQLSRGTTVEVEYRVMSKDDDPIWVLDKGRLLDDGSGSKTFYCVLIDITQRKLVQEELRLSLERHQIIMDQAADIIFEWDIAADTLKFSSNWRKKFGYDPIASSISQNIPLSANIHPDDMPAFVKIMRDTASGVPYSETEFRIKDITGRYRWNRIRATAQFDRNGRAIKAVGVIIDVSAEKEERLALIEQAQKDALTGLYNKAAIRSMVEQRMKEGDRDAMQAMLIIDVDYFKQVNDTYGHLCGDTLLSDIAEILKHHFRSSDLIGRIGGDEFLVYMPDVSSKITVGRKVELVMKAFSEIKPSADALSVTCSIGAAVFPYKDVNYFGLYQAADHALYHRKNSGRNGVSFYDPIACESNLIDGLAYSAVSESIDSEQCSSVEQALAQYTFQMLYQSIDIETAVNRLLEIVGRAYGVSRVYIFESSEDGLCCNNTFEWCAQGVTPEIQNLQGIRYEEDLGGYLRNFNSDGIFYCHDIKILNKSLYNILAPQGIRSLLQCAIMDKGQFKGYVGFDECRENCLWSKEQIRSLTLIANVLSVFLIKLRLENQLEKKNEVISRLEKGK